MDAEDLDKIDPVAHTAFRADVHTTAVDLRDPPFARDAEFWMHLTDYTTTQAIARTAREAGIGAIVYQSVRDPEAGWCVAVLTPDAFANKKPLPTSQKWWLAVHQDQVIWRRDHEVMVFQMGVPKESRKVKPAPAKTTRSTVRKSSHRKWTE